MPTNLTITVTGDWARADRALARRTLRRAASKAVGSEVTFFKGKVQEAFTSAGSSNGRPWEARKAGGKAFQGSTIPKQLRTNMPPGALTGHVYFPWSTSFKSGAKRGSKGSALRALLAHENGATIAIRITPKMVKGMHAAMRNKSGGRGASSGQKVTVGGTLLIRIPRRSFLGDTLDAHGGGKAQARFAKNLKIGLGDSAWKVL